ncbi:MAG TPA: hypothetical protein VFA21_18060 [Pyrinomonadaceae bacterium]|nr:hypothetical protein [Pyrinomonadaceae bacterium]
MTRVKLVGYNGRARSRSQRFRDFETWHFVTITQRTAAATIIATRGRV